MDLKISIEIDHSSAVEKMYVYRENGPKNKFYWLQGNELMISDFDADKVYKEGKGPKPFMILPYRFAGEFFSVLKRQLSKMGISTPPESFTAGELKATKKHLEDMREMLKVREHRIEIRREPAPARKKGAKIFPKFD